MRTESSSSTAPTRPSTRAPSARSVFSNQSAIVGPTLYNGGSDYLRSRLAYSFTDADRTVTYRAGDTISGGVELVAADPSRRRRRSTSDFAMRSDIVTRPLPLISGTAAVPSTVDVMVNGVKTYPQEVAPGPYSITNLPSNAGGGGDARVVMRDASGQAVETKLSLFNPSLSVWAPGIADFSLETGFARRNYGLRPTTTTGCWSAPGPGATAATDWLDARIARRGRRVPGQRRRRHGDAPRRYWAPCGPSTAAAVSTDPRGTGAQVYTAHEALWGRSSFAAGAQYAFGATMTWLR